MTKLLSPPWMRPIPIAPAPIPRLAVGNYAFSPRNRTCIQVCIIFSYYIILFVVLKARKCNHKNFYWMTLFASKIQNAWGEISALRVFSYDELNPSLLNKETHMGKTTWNLPRCEPARAPVVYFVDTISKCQCLWRKINALHPMQQIFNFFHEPFVRCALCWKINKSFFGREKRAPAVDGRDTCAAPREPREQQYCSSLD